MSDGEGPIRVLNPALRDHVPPPAGAARRNCGAPLAGRFCHDCGQDTVPAETALRSWKEQGMRLYRTLFALLLRPGLLTRDYLQGRRVAYIAPFTLYINTVAAFFLLSVLTDFRLSAFIQDASPTWMKDLVASRSAAEGLAPALFLEHADRRFQPVYTVCVSAISVLGYALVARLWFARKWHDWHGPVAFSLHYMAFVFITYLPIVSALNRVGGAGSHVPVLANIALIGTAAWLAAYLVLAVRRLFGDPWPWALLKGITFMFMGVPINTLMWYLAVAVTLTLA